MGVGTLNDKDCTLAIYNDGVTETWICILWETCFLTFTYIVCMWLRLVFQVLRDLRERDNDSRCFIVQRLSLTRKSELGVMCFRVPGRWSPWILLSFLTNPDFPKPQYTTSVVLMTMSTVLTEDSFIYTTLMYLHFHPKGIECFRHPKRWIL